MKNNMTESLEIALKKIRAGEPVEEVLAQFPDESADLRPLVVMAETFRGFEAVEMPTQAERVEDRKAFLAQARSIDDRAVSLPLVVRHKKWTSTINSWFNPPTSKEIKPMTILLMRAAIALLLVIASMGGTAALAANSLPDSALYPAKMAMEHVQLRLTGNPERRATQNLVMAQERVTEMVRLVEKGVDPGDAIILKLEQHLNTALQLAARLGDNSMYTILNNAQEMIRTQLQELNRVRAQVQEPCEECLCQVIQLLEWAQVRVQEGLQDGNAFRLRFQYGESPPSGELPPFGESAGEGNAYGQEALEKGAGPGEPGGNPDCADCVSVGESNQYGLEAETPGAGPGQPGGNPDCDCCERLGDAYQYGPKLG
jgi:hypothetical protein